uniref:Uncharacterized protein n=1 Tax=Prasiola crispa TaxID=173492 RepID=A0A0R8RY24_PRACR|nr:hypothetical protein [Prasiola crispa]
MYKKSKLACVKPITSVHSEPGSNSYYFFFFLRLQMTGISLSLGHVTRPSCHVYAQLKKCIFISNCLILKYHLVFLNMHNSFIKKMKENCYFSHVTMLNLRSGISTVVL